MDYEAAAAYLSTTPRHVRQLWQRREIAAVKVGRLVRFTTEDLDAYVRAQRQPAIAR
jgi:excisionase family DNA binding protein